MKNYEYNNFTNILVSNKIWKKNDQEKQSYSNSGFSPLQTIIKNRGCKLQHFFCLVYFHQFHYLHTIQPHFSEF